VYLYNVLVMEVFKGASLKSVAVVILSAMFRFHVFFCFFSSTCCIFIDGCNKKCFHYFAVQRVLDINAYYNFKFY